MARPAHTALRPLLGLAASLAVLGLPTPARAQHTPSPVPYDSIAAEGVSYAGAGREKAFDLRGPVIHIGLVAPLHGPEKTDGEAIVQAARMALAAGRPLPGGLQLELAVGDESGPAWGQAADAIMRLVLDEHAIAIVTSASGTTAHLSEQVCNRIGVPVLTLSTDPTTTQINLPWIIRLGPSDVLQARAIARDIYRQRGFERVLLVAESDHDGRIGGQEFIQAARQLGAPAPDALVLDPLQPGEGSFLGRLGAGLPQAVVLWVRPEIARMLLEATRQLAHQPVVYLSQEASQTGAGVTLSQQVSDAAMKTFPDTGIFTVASPKPEAGSDMNFARRYFMATGALPSPVASEAYDAIRLIANAVRQAGPNRARVRDQMMSVGNFPGVSGAISFDDQGNNRAGVHVVGLREE